MGIRGFGTVGKSGFEFAASVNCRCCKGLVGEIDGEEWVFNKVRYDVDWVVLKYWYWIEAAVLGMPGVVLEL